MTNVVFASNNIAHWPLTVSSTVAGTFDSTRVPYSILMQRFQSMTSPVFTPVVGDDSWVHFRMWYDDFGNNDSTDMITAFDINGNQLFTATKAFQQVRAHFNVSLIHEAGSITSQTTFPANSGFMNQFDFKYTAAAGALTLECYVNGALSTTDTIANNDGAYGGVAFFVLSSIFVSASGGGALYYSEIMVADGDTRNARVNLLRATAAGGETDWVGNAVDLGDDDPTTGMTTTLINQRQTVQLSAYTGADNISAVVVASQSYAGDNGPQNIRHTVRMSAVNYDSTADILLDNVLQYELTNFQINPGTSLPWVSGDLTSMEVGVISKT